MKHLVPFSAAFVDKLSPWRAAARAVAIGTCLLLLRVDCDAAPEEIQVYLDDLRAPGQLGVDVHNNFVVSGRSTPDYPGEQAPAKVYRLTPEFAYGLSKTTELGLYLLLSLIHISEPTRLRRSRMPSSA